MSYRKFHFWWGLSIATFDYERIISFFSPENFYVVWVSGMTSRFLWLELALFLLGRGGILNFWRFSWIPGIGCIMLYMFIKAMINHPSFEPTAKLGMILLLRLTDVRGKKSGTGSLKCSSTYIRSIFLGIRDLHLWFRTDHWVAWFSRNPPPTCYIPSVAGNSKSQNYPWRIGY
jgi:hypothetical protein